ncbi:MOSC domain-containing protein [Bosea sp. (in: a-proteobacteria)]|uniref:MOSC domain-containing protein n=1 Tax=Bosea sp. (in: a-proteobacteria) TaxID=1871050 RepID=UPI002FC82CCB
MLNPASPLARLIEAPMRPGRVVWIGLRPARRAAMAIVELATLDPAKGLIGDRYRSRTGGARHVTLIESEHLAAIASHLGLAAVDPDQLRRNIVVTGINLLALKNRRFRIGGATLEWSGDCHPCSRMEETLGTGGYNAVRGHGGITARVLAGGEVKLGDAVVRLA